MISSYVIREIQRSTTARGVVVFGLIDMPGGAPSFGYYIDTPAGSELVTCYQCTDAGKAYQWARHDFRGFVAGSRNLPSWVNRCY